MVRLLSGAALALPTAACADVMEVGRSGYSWIAGGPQAKIEDTEKPDAAVPAAGAFTNARSTVGPEQWRPYVAAIAAKYGLSPSLLEAVVWQESRWRSDATSPAGAHGLAQLMPATARYLGVDLRDPLSNLEGGARYLRIQLDAFDGDVERALAAYNAGPAPVRRAGGIPKFTETQAYVAAVMARLAEPVRR